MTGMYKTKRTPVLTHRSSQICSIVYQLMKNKKLFLVQCHRLMPLAVFTTLCLRHSPRGLSLPMTDVWLRLWGIIVPLLDDAKIRNMFVCANISVLKVLFFLII